MLLPYLVPLYLYLPSSKSFVLWSLTRLSRISISVIIYYTCPLSSYHTITSQNHNLIISCFSPVNLFSTIFLFVFSYRSLRSFHNSSLLFLSSYFSLTILSYDVQLEILTNITIYLDLNRNERCQFEIINRFDYFILATLTIM